MVHHYNHSLPNTLNTHDPLLLGHMWLTNLVWFNPTLSLLLAYTTPLNVTEGKHNNVDSSNFTYPWTSNALFKCSAILLHFPLCHFLRQYFISSLFFKFPPPPLTLLSVDDRTFYFTRNIQANRRVQAPSTIFTHYPLGSYSMPSSLLLKWMKCLCTSTEGQFFHVSRNTTTLLPTLEHNSLQHFFLSLIDYSHKCNRACCFSYMKEKYSLDLTSSSSFFPILLWPIIRKFLKICQSMSPQ